MSAENQKEQSSVVAPFAIEINTYLREVESLRKSYPLVMALLNKTRMGSINQLIQTGSRGKAKQLTEENPIASLDSKTLASLLGSTKETLQIFEATRILSRSFLVALVSQWDAFFGRLLRLVIAELPEESRGMSSPDEKDKDGKSDIGLISYTELSRFNSIEDAKSHLIDKRVGAVLRKNHTDQFRWLENRLKGKDGDKEFSLRKGEEWKPFIEITQRRHLYVHTNGTVTADYMAECQSAEIKLQDDVKPGNILQVTDDYFYDACRWMYEIALKLGTVTWRRLRAKSQADLTESDGFYNSRCVELIAEDENQSAVRLLRSAKHEWRDKFGTVEMKHYIDFNYVQALKWSGQDALFKEELAKLDTSLDDRFKLCIAALSDKFVEAAKLMRKIGPNHEHLTVDAYREWPILRTFKESQEFQDAFTEVFGEPYDPNESSPSILKKMSEALDKTNID